MADLDLMIRLEDIDRAIAVFEECGGLRGEPLVREDFFPRFHYEIDYKFGTVYPVRVDLHVRPFRPLRYARLVPPDAIWSAAESLTIGRGTILVPSTEDMLIHLAVHAAVHGSTHGKWLEDIRKWIDRNEARIDWDRFLATVERWHLVLPVRAALASVEHEFGQTCPPAVSRRLSLLRVNWRDRLALRQAPRDAGHPTAHVAVDALVTPGWRFTLSYLRAQILPDQAHMADWYYRRHWGWLPCAHVIRWLGPIFSLVPRRWRWFSSIETRPSRIHGVGLFAARYIKAGEVLARYHGRRVRHKGMYVVPHRMPAGETHLYELTGKLRFLNHSCHPNARLVDFRLVAVSPISAGQEVTIDYGSDACDCRRSERRGQEGTSLVEPTAHVA